MHVTRAIYIAAGAPPMQDDEYGACRLCGLLDTGMPFIGWVKDTFTDWDKLRPGGVICQACQFCTAEAAPGLAERVGKEKPQKMRNYSHFVVGGVWSPLSKGNKAEMRRLLFAGADVVVIAESGQKHLLPFARVGWWTLELATMQPFPDRLLTVFSVVEPLYQAGISKAEIETGRYENKRIMAIGVERWYAAEKQIKQWRGSVPLALALFLAQKEDDGQRNDSD